MGWSRKVLGSMLVVVGGMVVCQVYLGYGCVVSSADV